MGHSKTVAFGRRRMTLLSPQSP